MIFRALNIKLAQSRSLPENQSTTLFSICKEMGQVDVNAELIAVLAPTEFSIEVDMSQVLGRQLLGDKFWARVYPLLHIGDLKSPGFIVGCTCQYLHISAHFLSTLDQAPSWLIWVGSVAGWGVIFGSILNMQMQQWRMGFASLECWFVRIQFIVLSCVLIDAAGFDERSIVYITMVAVDLFAGSRMDAMPLVPSPHHVQNSRVLPYLVRTRESACFFAYCAPHGGVQDFKTSWAFTAVWGVTLLCFVGEAVMLQLGNVPSEHGPPKQVRVQTWGRWTRLSRSHWLASVFILQASDCVLHDRGGCLSLAAYHSSPQR